MALSADIMNSWKMQDNINYNPFMRIMEGRFSWKEDLEKSCTSIDNLFEKCGANNANFFKKMGAAYGLLSLVGTYKSYFNINNTQDFSLNSNISIWCAGLCYSLYRIGRDMKHR